MQSSSPLKISHLKISDWAVEDRPREKLRDKGSAVLSDAELIGILISSGTRDMSAVSLAQHILRHNNNNLDNLAKLSVKELQQFRGIGEAKAITIASALELGRRRSHPKRLKKIQVMHPKDVYELMQPALTDKLTEEFWIILVNSANYIIHTQRISQGGLDSTIADPRVIFKLALEHTSAGIILVHNHPSGNPCPSREDVQITGRLVKNGHLLDVPVLDHVIVGEDGYFSLRDENLM